MYIVVRVGFELRLRLLVFWLLMVVRLLAHINRGSLLRDIALARAGFSLRLVSVRISFSCACACGLLTAEAERFGCACSRFCGGTTPHTPRVLRTPSVTLRKTRTSLCLRTSCAYRLAKTLLCLLLWETTKSRSRRLLH